MDIKTYLNGLDEEGKFFMRLYGTILSLKNRNFYCSFGSIKISSQTRDYECGILYFLYLMYVRGGHCEYLLEKYNVASFFQRFPVYEKLSLEILFLINLEDRDDFVLKHTNLNVLGNLLDFDTVCNKLEKELKVSCGTSQIKTEEPVLEDLLWKMVLRGRFSPIIAGGIGKHNLEQLYEKLSEERNVFRKVTLSPESKQEKKSEQEKDIILPKKNIELEFGTVLTDHLFKKNPLIGRTKEFRNMCALLMDEEKSLILHGKPGVGKTTLMKGLAYHIQKKTAPNALRNKTIVEMSGTEIVSGAKYRGTLEEKLLEMIDRLIKHGNCILYIDEIHTLIGAGTSMENNLDVSNILKPYLGDGRIKIIGATTTAEYNIIKKDGAFSRRFQALEIKEQTKEEVLQILDRMIAYYEKEKNILFLSNSELKEAILNEILTICEEQYQTATPKLYAPDLPLTILRNGYNYALLDEKKEVDIFSVLEGVENTNAINEKGKEYFKSKISPLFKH